MVRQRQDNFSKRGADGAAPLSRGSSSSCAAPFVECDYFRSRSNEEDFCTAAEQQMLWESFAETQANHPQQPVQKEAAPRRSSAVRPEQFYIGSPPTSEESDGRGAFCFSKRGARASSASFSKRGSTAPTPSSSSKAAPPVDRAAVPTQLLQSIEFDGTRNDEDPVDRAVPRHGERRNARTSKQFPDETHSAGATAGASTSNKRAGSSADFRSEQFGPKFADLETEDIGSKRADLETEDIGSKRADLETEDIGSKRADLETEDIGSDHWEEEPPPNEDRSWRSLGRKTSSSTKQKGAPTPSATAATAGAGRRAIHQKRNEASPVRRERNEASPRRKYSQRDLSDEQHACGRTPNEISPPYSQRGLSNEISPTNSSGQICCFFPQRSQQEQEETSRTPNSTSWTGSSATAASSCLKGGETSSSSKQRGASSQQKASATQRRPGAASTESVRKRHDGMLFGASDEELDQCLPRGAGGRAEAKKRTGASDGELGDEPAGASAGELGDGASDGGSSPSSPSEAGASDGELGELHPPRNDHPRPHGEPGELHPPRNPRPHRGTASSSSKRSTHTGELQPYLNRNQLRRRNEPNCSSSEKSSEGDVLFWTNAMGASKEVGFFCQKSFLDKERPGRQRGGTRPCLTSCAPRT